MHKGDFKNLEFANSATYCYEGKKLLPPSCGGNFILLHEHNMGEGTKEFLGTRECIICSEAVLPKPILTQVSLSTVFHQLDFFKHIPVIANYFPVCVWKKC